MILTIFFYFFDFTITCSNFCIVSQWFYLLKYCFPFSYSFFLMMDQESFNGLMDWKARSHSAFSVSLNSLSKRRGRNVVTHEYDCFWRTYNNSMHFRTWSSLNEPTMLQLTSLYHNISIETVCYLESRFGCLFPRRIQDIA